MGQKENELELSRLKQEYLQEREKRKKAEAAIAELQPRIKSSLTTQNLEAHKMKFMDRSNPKYRKVPSSINNKEWVRWQVNIGRSKLQMAQNFNDNNRVQNQEYDSQQAKEKTANALKEMIGNKYDGQGNFKFGPNWNQGILL